jgi:hypothetical protein
MKIMSQKMWHYFIFQIVSILLAINFVDSMKKIFGSKGKQRDTSSGLFFILKKIFFKLIKLDIRLLFNFYWEIFFNF